jgi:hypothetical protein
MVMYPLSLFRNGLMPVSPGADNETQQTQEAYESDGEWIRTPSDFIWNLFRGLIGKISSDIDKSVPPGTIPKSSCAVPGRNFFSKWIFKNDFHRRWTGLYGIDDGRTSNSGGTFPLLSAVTNTEVMNAIQQQLGVSSGSSGSAWEIIQKVLGVMLMEVGTTPAPPIGTLSMKSRTYTVEYTSRFKNSDKQYGAIFTHYVKPQCFCAVPPICNTIFPCMITSYSFAENYMAQPTRIYLGEDFLTSIISSNATGLVDLTKQLMTTGYPIEVKQWMKSYILDPKQNTKNFLLYPEELFKGPISKHVGTPPWAYLLEKFYQGLSRGKDTSVEKTTVAIPSATTSPASTVATRSLTKEEQSTVRGTAKVRMLKTYKPWIQDFVTSLGLPPFFVPMAMATIWLESKGDPATVHGTTDKVTKLFRPSGCIGFKAEYTVGYVREITRQFPAVGAIAMSLTAGKSDKDAMHDERFAILATLWHMKKDYDMAKEWYTGTVKEVTSANLAAGDSVPAKPTLAHIMCVGYIYPAVAHGVASASYTPGDDIYDAKGKKVNFAGAAEGRKSAETLWRKRSQDMSDYWKMFESLNADNAIVVRSPRNPALDTSADYT